MKRTRHFNSSAGNFHFGFRRASRQKFDCVAIGVARTEIERFVVGFLAKNLVDVADFLKPDRPLRIVDFAQALDDVAHRHVAGGQTVVLSHHDVFGVGTGSMQTFFQPGQCKARGLRAISQAIEELGRKGRIIDQRIDLTKQSSRGFRIVETDNLVDNLIRLLAHAARALDANRNTAEIFDENKTDDRRQRPQLADLQRLGRLITVNQCRHVFARHSAVRMRHIKPAERHDARYGDATNRHRRQLTIELAREIATNFLDRFFDHVVVVEKPFRCGRNRRTVFRVNRGGTINAQDFLLVFAMAFEEIELHETGEAVSTVARKRGTGLIQFFDRHVGSTDRIVVIDLFGFGITGGGRRRNMK